MYAYFLIIILDMFTLWKLSMHSNMFPLFIVWYVHHSSLNSCSTDTHWPMKLIYLHCDCPELISVNWKWFTCISTSLCRPSNSNFSVRILIRFVHLEAWKFNLISNMSDEICSRVCFALFCCGNIMISEWIHIHVYLCPSLLLHWRPWSNHEDIGKNDQNLMDLLEASDAIWRHRTWSTLVQANGLLPDGTKPLLESVLTDQSSVRLCYIYPMATPREMLKISILDTFMSLKVITFKITTISFRDQCVNHKKA